MYFGHYNIRHEYWFPSKSDSTIQDPISCFIVKYSYLMKKEKKIKKNKNQTISLPDNTWVLGNKKEEIFKAEGKSTWFRGF